MSSNPLTPSFRKVHTVPSDAAHPSVVQAVRDHDKSITDLNQSIVSLSSRTTTLETNSSSVSSGSANNSSSPAASAAASAAASSVVSSPTALARIALAVAPFITQPGSVTGGVVNNQTGTTAYTVQQSDNAGLIVFDDASAIAISLPLVTIPFYTTISNQGSSTATLTPVSGTINGSSSFPLDGGLFVTIYYDGKNWWADAPPGGGGGGTITSIIAGTGLSGGGSTGAVTVALTTPVSIADGGTGTATPGLVAGSGIAITGTWPNETIASTGGGSGVASLQGETGALTLTSSGATVTITTPTSTTINLEATGGGGLPVNNPTFTGIITGPALSINHLGGGGGSPTVALHGAAGSGASVLIAGTDSLGEMQITAGTGATTGFIATITLAVTYPLGIFLAMVVGFNQATSVSESFAGFTAGANQWELNAGFAMTAGQTYTIQYLVAGN